MNKQETEIWSIKATLAKEYGIQPSEVDRMPLCAIGTLLAALGDKVSRQKMDEAMMKARMQGMGQG